jgi:glycosyltransferase involved in cell wall biosynthesis
MIVGGGYRTEELKKLTYKYNLDGKVIFTGAVPHDLIPQYIAAADICVACFEENEVTLCKSPLKIVEYLASGKAIVASNVGEVSNMIKDAGILCPPGDVQSLVAGIIKLLQDNNLRRNLERLARQRAENKYNWTVTVDNLLNAYEEAIKKNRARQ